MGDQLVLERTDGWPNGLSHMFLGLGLLLALAGVVFHAPEYRRVAGFFVGSSLTLHFYRRGTLIDRRIRTLYRWWGLGVPGRPAWRLRYTEGRSIQGYKNVAVHRTTRFDTWKTWRNNMIHVQLERPDDKLGPSVPFRLRLIVDDEYVAQEPAVQSGNRVAEFLGLPLTMEL